MLERKYDGKWTGNFTIQKSGTYTAFIKQFINTVIESVIDKYEKESYYLITLYQVS